jgi:hypothetical protein
MDLSRNIYEQLHADRDGTFSHYRRAFVNFSVVVGNMGYCGSIPAFRFKIRLLGGGVNSLHGIDEVTWVSIFFQAGEQLDAYLHEHFPGEDIHVHKPNMISWRTRD